MLCGYYLQSHSASSTVPILIIYLMKHCEVQDVSYVCNPETDKRSAFLATFYPGIDTGFMRIGILDLWHDIL